MLQLSYVLSSPVCCRNYVGSGQQITHSVTGEVVEPVPIQSLVPDVPLVDGSYVTLSLKEVAGSDLISKHAKLLGLCIQDLLWCAVSLLNTVVFQIHVE
ncbi:hypothetical protein GCM10023156_37840 [Novipirellula rosea]|uniref:Uncharacterized protein n=1 Tax=Novipirellula rosea TaxID=1031540 RepID=A0ABP8N3N3_9BACT